jgi:hypothetical protein
MHNVVNAPEERDGFGGVPAFEDCSWWMFMMISWFVEELIRVVGEMPGGWAGRLGPFGPRATLVRWSFCKRGFW